MPGANKRALHGCRYAPCAGCTTWGRLGQLIKIVSFKKPYVTSGHLFSLVPYSTLRTVDLATDPKGFQPLNSWLKTWHRHN